MSKLKIGWNPDWNPRYYGVRQDEHPEPHHTKIIWWIAQGHWIAREEYVEGGDVLPVLCGDHKCEGWAYYGDGVKPLDDKTRAGIEKLLTVPADAIELTIGAASVTQIRYSLDISTPWDAKQIGNLETTIPLIADAGIGKPGICIKGIRADYAEPFLDCDRWMSTRDGGSPVYMVRGDALMGIVMPLHLGVDSISFYNAASAEGHRLGVFAHVGRQEEPQGALEAMPKGH